MPVTPKIVKVQGFKNPVARNLMQQLQKEKRD